MSFCHLSELRLRGQLLRMRNNRNRIHRIGVLMAIPNDADAHVRAVALEEGLQKLGWTVGSNIQIDYSFPGGDAERMYANAKELVSSAPDLIVAVTNPALQATLDVTRTQSILFLQVSDPVGGGFVTESRPSRR